MANQTFGRWRTEHGAEVEYLEASGKPRLLTCWPTPANRQKPPLFSTRHEIRIDPADLRPVDYSGFYAPVLDQGSTGSCVGHGDGTAFQRTWSMANQTRRDFSACYLYSLINGGVDGGANVGDAVNTLKNGGICLLETAPEGKIFRNQYDRVKADAEAKRFRLRLCWTLASPADMPTALMLGYIIPTTIRVGGNFNNLDANGVPPVSRGVGNHCVEVHGLVKLPDGRWGYRAQNSWSESWGVKGFFVLTDDHFVNQPYWEGYAFQAAMEDPQETNEPPPAPAEAVA